ncbi:Arylsulfatase B [Eumeta japonica]|uniref:Arylsulfatase B n=1 Tax=Eumeta variegata TaxID=151549 RepID=A0A4C1WD11_EUMVA|nr:Arylsulfatase B [Eumeta japonica]
MVFKTFNVGLVWAIAALINATNQQRPNIVLIIADDLGWDDVSFHGSAQVLTPNIDLLAYSGAALQRYYTHSQCSPSRAAMLTGKYAHRLGMQGHPIVVSEDRGIPLNEKLLPQYLKELGYATHLVGKWHVGHSREAYLPTSRGFDSHFGHRSGFIDYYEYIIEEKLSTGKVAGLDLYRNLTPAWDVEGYITDVYTHEALKLIKYRDKNKPFFLQLAHSAPHSANEGAPLQAPPELVRAMRHVELGERRLYAAMVKKLDDSVSQVVEALEQEEMLNNTVIVFISDNGGMTEGFTRNWASNWPLRGLKSSPFEGGIRAAGLIWFKDIHYADDPTWKGRMHSVDWLPTLLKAAGGGKVEGIDGVNLWDSILRGDSASRYEHVEIDDYTGYAAITLGKYKLITGRTVPAHSKCKYGDELRGVIGQPPSYETALENSVVYAVLKRTGKPLDVEWMMKKRLLLTIDCGDVPGNQSSCGTEEDKVSLFNIDEDPCERRDLSKILPEVVQQLHRRITEEWDKRVPRIVPMVRDPKSKPSLHNYTWTTWIDDTLSN